MVDRNIAFVAKGDIPSSPPPATEVGAVAWVRHNLFRGPVNSIITVVCLGVILSLLPGMINWLFINAVWNAGSLKECRELTEGGACWAVIAERWPQFLFGFYPVDLRWRPAIVFVLLAFAVFFALGENIPFKKQGMIYAALFPFIAYAMIWGGPVLPLLALMATPIVGYAVYTGLAKAIQPFIARPVAVLLALAWLWFVPGADVLAVGPGFEPVESRLLGGFMLALIIGVSGIVMSLPIGILLALGRRSDLFFIKTLCIVFIEFIRGVPLITLLFVANSVLAYLFPPGSNLDLILRVVIMVTIFASAYMAEVIRGGLAALPSGQYEAADSLGLDYWKSMRLIILPQALKVSIPNIVSAFIGLFKDTTLVVVIGLMDPIGLIGNIRADSNWNGIVWELFFFVGLFFFLACFGMSRYSQYLERKLATGHR
jgi:general L-amino acid transport system permease protein